MSEVLVCWRCGENLAALSLPLSRMDECPACSVHLHVCRMCSFYDPAVTRACREDDADDVGEKERANFCDYFQPMPNAFDASAAAAEQQARNELDNLFQGEAAADEHPADGDQQAADDLFK